MQSWWREYNIFEVNVILLCIMSNSAPHCNINSVCACHLRKGALIDAHGIRNAVHGCCGSVTKIIYLVEWMGESHPQHNSESFKDKSFMNTVPIYLYTPAHQRAHTPRHISISMLHGHHKAGITSCHKWVKYYICLRSTILVIWVLPKRMIWHWYQYLLWFHVQKGKEAIEIYFI